MGQREGNSPILNRRGELLKLLGRWLVPLSCGRLVTIYSKVRIKGKGILGKKKNTEKNQIGNCKFHISESLFRKRTEEDKDIEVGYFPGGPVVKILCSQCREPSFNPWSRN